MKTETRQRQLDMLHGSIWNKIPQFALPVAATAILEQLFNASDVAVVGNFTGAESTIAVAAVGSNSPIIGLIVNLFIGIGLGTNVVIAHAIGYGDRASVEKAVHTSIVASLFGGAGVAVLGELAAAPLLTMLHVPADVFPMALLYLRIYFLGMPVILLYNFEAAIFRSVGETRIPLIALAGSGVLQIGLPAGIQSAVFSFANIVVQSAINSLGTVVMAASSAAFNIEIITYDILNSFSQACTTFTGQNFGAGKPQRCKRVLALCLGEGMLILALAIGAILFFGKPLLSIFNRDPQVIETGYIRLMLIVTAHAFSLIYEVLSGYLRGFGISLVPAALTTLCICGIRISWIRLVFPKAPTFRTIMTVYPVSLSLTALVLFAALLYYRPARKFAALQNKKAAI